MKIRRVVIICIAICKPKNIEIPKMETFQQCFSRNRDGAGVVWLQDGKLHIEKGFMKFEHFKNFIENLSKEIDTKNTLMGFHFRIKTHGEVSRENTHPFPISTNMNDLKQLSFETDGKVAIHNGIISKFDGTLKNSDTQEFITEFLAPLNNGVPNWESNEHLVKLVENMLDSKMCVFNTNGTYKILGKGWIEDEGVWYSNSSYKTYNYSSKSYYHNYNWCDDDLEDDYDYYGYRNNYNSKISKNQIVSSNSKKLLYYIPNQNNSFLLNRSDFDNKLFENDLLRNMTNTVLAIDKNNNTYIFDITKRIFCKKDNLVVVDIETLKPFSFIEKESFFEEVDVV